MRELKELKNTGLIPPVGDPKEFWFGGISGIVHEIRNTLADWLKWQPTDEQQNYKKFDDYGCVSHSLENDCEMQFGWMFESKLVRDQDLKWLQENGYFDVNGKINFDDRALVVLSGTRPGG